jgi:hypothetical protein
MFPVAVKVEPYTVKLTPVVVAPPEFLAVTMYVAADATTFGVPRITPVTPSRMSPDGRAGATDQDATGPPLTLGTLEVMGIPTV